MGQFRCDRCEEYGDSKGGDCMEDPTDSKELIHESCMSDWEIREKLNSDYYGRDYESGTSTM